MKRSELIRMLLSYNDAAQQAEVDELRSVSRRRVDVFSADTYDPGHFTMSAFVTDVALTRLVLVLHGRIGWWLQPGGHIERDDPSLLAALWRELEEEAGLLDLEPRDPDLFDVDIHIVPATELRPEHRHFDLRFHLTTTQKHLEAAPGADPVAWAPLDDVDAWTTDQSVLRATAKLLALEKDGQRRP